MWKALTAWVGRFDKAFVAWVALALALMLPAAQWPRVVPAEGVQEDGLNAASQPLQQHDEEDHPLSPCEEPSCALESLEDDAILHDRHVFILVGLKLELSAVSQFAPEALHTRVLDRPPLHTA
jgi:hypothetical protein